MKPKYGPHNEGNSILSSLKKESNLVTVSLVNKKCYFEIVLKKRVRICATVLIKNTALLVRTHKLLRVLLQEQKTRECKWHYTIGDACSPILFINSLAILSQKGCYSNAGKIPFKRFWILNHSAPSTGCAPIGVRQEN